MIVMSKPVRFDPNKPLQVGGQAVIEGVMMRAPGHIATAVRRANGEILVKKEEYVSLAEKYPLLKLPVLRGAVGLIEMLFIGVRTLNFSAEVAMEDLERTERVKRNGEPKRKARAVTNLRLALTVLVSLAIGILLFFVTPLFITTNLADVEQDALWFNLIAGSVRIVILLTYLLAISLMKDVRRLFEYHGAEHKAVFAFETGSALTVESAQEFTRFHPRCGTSFILIVMFVSILLFAFTDALIIQWLGGITLPIRIATHLPLVPLVGGLSYEIIRISATHSTTTLGKVAVAPGLWLQRITTKHPENAQLEVALLALKAALRIDEVESAERETEDVLQTARLTLE